MTREELAAVLRLPVANARPALSVSEIADVVLAALKPELDVAEAALVVRATERRAPTEAAHVVLFGEQLDAFEQAVDSLEAARKFRG